MAGEPRIDFNDAGLVINSARIDAQLDTVPEGPRPGIVAPLQTTQPDMHRLALSWAHAIYERDLVDPHSRCAVLRRIQADAMWLDTILVVCPIDGSPSAREPGRSTKLHFGGSSNIACDQWVDDPGSMRSLEILDQAQLFRDILARSNFSVADCRFAVFRSDAAQLIAGVIRLRADDPLPILGPPSLFDYGPLVIARALLKVDVVGALLLKGDVGALSEALHLPGFEATPRWQFSYHLGTGESLGSVQVDWPSVLFEITLDVPEKARQWLQTTRRLHGDGPLYPDVATGLAHQLFDRDLLPPANANYEGMLHVVAPDHRARIRSVRIEGDNASFSIDRRELPEDGQLSVDLYMATEAGPSPTRIPFEGDIATLQAPAPIKRLLAHLVVGQNDVLDEVQVGFPFARGADNRVEPSIRQQQAEVAAALAGGEGRTIEFKRALNLKRGDGDRSKEEFAETVAAFANAEGGIIVLGVDRNGVVVGFSLSDTEGIDALIGERCDPAPPYAVERVELADVGKTVMLVRVQRGPDPPYTINGTTFIRVGATDRRASRAQQDQLRVATAYPVVGSTW